MISNITYRLSTFSDYSMLAYNKKDVISILTEFDDINLAQSIVQEIIPNGTISQRMQFTAQNGHALFVINSDRIDIQMTSDKKEGFDQDEITGVKENYLWVICQSF